MRREAGSWEPSGAREVGGEGAPAGPKRGASPSCLQPQLPALAKGAPLCSVEDSEGPCESGSQVMLVPCSLRASHVLLGVPFKAPWNPPPLPFCLSDLSSGYCPLLVSHSSQLICLLFFKAPGPLPQAGPTSSQVPPLLAG